MKQFRYLLKLHNGKLKHGVGVDVESAARDARVDIAEIKRATPVAIELTAEEKKEKAKLKAKQRRRAIKALELARRAKAVKAANKKAVGEVE